MTGPTAAVRCIHCGKEGTHRVCDECFKATTTAVTTPTREEMVALIADGLASRDGRQGRHVEAGQMLAAYVEARMPWNHVSINEVRARFEDE